LLALLVVAKYALSVWGRLTSFIRVAPEGLEYRLWPSRQIRCGWQELERVGKYFLTDVIYLKSFQISGLSWSLRKPLKWLNFSNQVMIPLSGMQGWPEGELKADLVHFAPGLFDPVSGKPAGIAVAGRSYRKALTQDERTYAALAHAGALTIPVLVPLIFWWLERKKSAYVRCQARQALVYQVVMLLLCAGILAGMLAPVWSLALLKQGGVPEMSVWGAFFMLSLALSAILVVMVLVATAASVRTYQGEDFRYPLIGRLCGRDG
jgi:uncharacterized Tic20 family protein